MESASVQFGRCQHPSLARTARTGFRCYAAVTCISARWPLVLLHRAADRREQGWKARREQQNVPAAAGL